MLLWLPSLVWALISPCKWELERDNECAYGLPGGGYKDKRWLKGK